MVQKKQNNKAFTLTVVLMISLILALLLPTAIAWFTDSETTNSTSTINFGSVAIGTSDSISLINTSSNVRGVNYILPGDVINLSFEVFNKGNVDSYAKIFYDVKVLYNDTDITPLLFDDTDPVTQPYLRVSDISSATTPTFYEDGSELNQVFVLTKDQTQGNGKIINGVLEFAKTLPNSVTDGANTYVLNGAPQGTKLELIIDIQMATIQKDNITIDNATTELSSLIQELMPIEYTLGYVNGTPTLMVGTTPIQTTSYYNVTSSSSESEAYAFIAELDGEKTLLAVVGDGDMNNYNSSTQPWKDSRSNITEAEIEDGITNIGNYAFYGCTNLATVNIPNSVTNIGSNAFNGCTNLVSVNIPNSVTTIAYAAYSGCTSLTQITIPNTVKTISGSVFEGCSNLTTVTLPNSITAINSYTFAECSNLTNITIPESVTIIDSYAFSSCTSLTEIVIPNGVTRIGGFSGSGGTFSGCTNLTKVTIPNSVTNIRSSTFARCSKLTSITLPEKITYISSYLFDQCTSLTEIIIPNSVDDILDNAFWGCTSLKTVVMGSKVQSIGDYAFKHCTSLTNIKFGNSLTKIGQYAFTGCTSLTAIYMEHTSSTGLILDHNWNNSKPVYYFSETQKHGTWRYVNNTPMPWYTDGYSIDIDNKLLYNQQYISTTNAWNVSNTSSDNVWAFTTNNNGNTTLIIVGNGAMKNYGSSYKQWYSIMGNIKSIEITSGVTSISNFAFKDCTSLISVVIPNTVGSIGHQSFYGCTSLTSVVIPNGVTSIGDYAFYECSSLTSVVIPNSVTEIGADAFWGCESLTSVVIPNSVASISNYAFWRCTSLTSVVIGDSVTEIGQSAFYDCTSLTSVVIPDSVTEIGISAFNGCTSLTSVVIPDSVKSISDSAFQSCTSLTSVVIGDSVTSIAYAAFSGCTSLTSVVIPDSVTSIGDSAFYYCTDLTAIYMEHTSSTDLTLGNYWNGSTQVYCFSETNQNGYWHYVNNVPTLW